MTDNKPEPIGRISDVAITEEGLVASGGWCAPTSVLHGTIEAGPSLSSLITLPDFRMLRPGTPEYDARQREIEHEKLQEAALSRYVTRAIGDVAKRQDEIIEQALAAAELLELDVHVYPPPYDQTLWKWTQHGMAAYRFLGIELTERSERRGATSSPIPILFWHDPYRDDCLWDD